MQTIKGDRQTKRQKDRHREKTWHGRERGRDERRREGGQKRECFFVSGRDRGEGERLPDRQTDRDRWRQMTE